MLSGVLRSDRAVDVNIAIMRAFVRMRELASDHRELARKMAQLERRCDDNFKQVFAAIRQLMAPEPATKNPVGFRKKSK